MSNSYRKELVRIHRSDNTWGSRGYNWAYLVAGIALVERCQTILDYGCGKGTLGETLRHAGFDTADYDPGIPGKDAPAEPADLVVCADVLEHIEPQLLPDVMADIRRVTRRSLFVAISTRLAGRKLSDGRNAHLIVKDDDWWRARFGSFDIRRTWKTGGHEWVALMSIKSAAASPDSMISG